MTSLLCLLVLLGVYAGNTWAEEFCLEKKGGTVSIVYCEHGCCGTEEDRECCTNYVGLIVGIVIGVIVLVSGIVFVICLVKYCNRKKQVGMVVSQPAATNVAVVNTTTSQQQYAAYPSAAYPPPPPTYPGQQVYGQQVYGQPPPPTHG